MTTGKDILNIITNEPEYDFLRTNPQLGSNIILLGLGGSHAYGMNTETSDIDIRGVALNSKREILLGKDFEQVVEPITDTTIYSFNKMIDLLTANNPNTIEILGLEPEQYLYISPEGKILLENRTAFLSKRAIASFAGYANQQLRRLENKVDRTVDLPKHLRHIIETMNHAKYSFLDKYEGYEDSMITLTLSGTGSDSGILLNIAMKDMPLERFNDMYGELKEIERAYSKIGKRNSRAIEHEKLGKHMAHLIRLYYMCFDIMENLEIKTYREKEHEILMSVRRGEYLNEEGYPKEEFYEIVEGLEKRFNELKEKTKLPEHPNYEKIEEIKMEINERVVKK